MMGEGQGVGDMETARTFGETIVGLEGTSGERSPKTPHALTFLKARMGQMVPKVRDFNECMGGTAGPEAKERVRELARLLDVVSDGLWEMVGEGE